MEFLASTAYGNSAVGGIPVSEWMKAGNITATLFAGLFRPVAPLRERISAAAARLFPASGQVSPSSSPFGIYSFLRLSPQPRNRQRTMSMFHFCWVYRLWCEFEPAGKSGQQVPPYTPVNIACHQGPSSPQARLAFVTASLHLPRALIELFRHPTRNNTNKQNLPQLFMPFAIQDNVSAR